MAMPASPVPQGPQPTNELAVRYDPIPAAARVAKAHGWVRSRALSLVMTIIILTLGYLYFPGGRSPGSFVIMAIVLGLSIAWLAGAIISERMSKQYLRSLGEGIAFRANRSCVEVKGSFVPWQEVVSLGTGKGRIGEGPNLVVQRTSGDDLRVPFSQLDSLPAGIDGAVRAYSAGRFGVDLSGLDD